MKSRIMYIECKAGEISGPARIGRVTFSKSGKSLYYEGRRFHTLSGSGFKANYADSETRVNIGFLVVRGGAATDSIPERLKSMRTSEKNIGPQSGTCRTRRTKS